MKFEGGFQGRTNKLVDCCYSFWQGGMFPIIHSILVKGIPLFFFSFHTLHFNYIENAESRSQFVANNKLTVNVLLNKER